jgi:hypothetical protein
MKKTSSRGAYAPARKKQMAIRRAPIVECKKDERITWNGGTALTPAVWPALSDFNAIQIGDTASTTGTAQQCIVGVPETFLYRTQGFANDEMVGDSVFIKYLKCKFEFKLPEDANLIHFPQCRLYLVHGFVRDTISANELTTPKLSELTRTTIDDYVQHQVNEYFNNSTEPIAFTPKGAKNGPVKILRTKEVRWNKSRSILPDPVRSNPDESGTPQMLGSLPTKNVSCEWPMMRKQKYERAPALTVSADPANTRTKMANYFANNVDPKLGYPFWCIYMPGGENIVYSDVANRVRCRINDCTWFTDS